MFGCIANLLASLSYVTMLPFLITSSFAWVMQTYIRRRAKLQYPKVVLINKFSKIYTKFNEFLLFQRTMFFECSEARVHGCIDRRDV